MTRAPARPAGLRDDGVAEIARWSDVGMTDVDVLRALGIALASTTVGRRDFTAWWSGAAAPCDATGG